jgi:hypothetical protein
VRQDAPFDGTLCEPAIAWAVQRFVADPKLESNTLARLPAPYEVVGLRGNEQIESFVVKTAWPCGPYMLAADTQIST